MRSRKLTSVVVTLLFLVAYLPAGLAPPPTAHASGADVLIDDDARSLADASWVRQHTPRADNYITDSLDSLGNPDGVTMKQVLRGHYLFFSSSDNLSNNIKQELAIGPGEWSIEFEARFADLITPSEDPTWNGFTVDTVADGKRFRVTFNSKQSDQGATSSEFNVLITEGTASNDYHETTVRTDFAERHRWGIEYDGGSTISVTMDGKLIARSSAANVATGYSDAVRLYNASMGLQSGTNEIYLDSFKFTKGASLAYDEGVINDTATSLTNAGWTVSDPESGQYITDASQSQGNPNSVTLAPVPNGQYLVFGDATSTASEPASMSKTVAIGDDPWTLDLKARIASLVESGVPGGDAGLTLDVVAGQRRYQLIFSDDETLTAIKGTAHKQLTVPMPTDDQFHDWSISYDGGNTIHVGLDGASVARFDGIGSATTDADSVTLANGTQDAVASTTEVYIDSIELTSESVPTWASVKSDPYTAEQTETALLDFTERLADSGWTRAGDFDAGNYIADFHDNFDTNNTWLPPVRQSTFAFFADESGTSSSIALGTPTESSLSIGSEPWLLELDMNISDLITPASLGDDAGITAEVYANAQLYRVNFSTLDSSGELKVSVQTDGGGTTHSEQVTLPPDGTFHQWGIGNDGASEITIILDGETVLRVPSVNVSASGEDRILLHNHAQTISEGSNIVDINLIKLAKENVPTWVHAAINDSADSLADAGWTRSADPIEASYITDEQHSLGNPNGVEMLPVPPSEYLFYSAEDGLRSHIRRSQSIGDGPWYTQVEARIADLPTPAAYHAWRGFTVDVHAASKRVRVAFNELDGNGDIKIYLLKPGNTYEAQTVALPADGGFHTWGISFDGSNRVTVDLDGDVVANFTYADIASSAPDRIELAADTLNLASGSTEVYVDKVQLLRNTIPPLRDPNAAPDTVLDDPASSLASAGWTHTPTASGTYIIDETNSLENQNSPLLPVPSGQYLAYSDATSDGTSFVTHVNSIGSGAWTMEFDAKIEDLATVTNYYLWHGVTFNIFAGNKRYMVALNNYDPEEHTIKAYVITAENNQFVERTVHLPDDGLFHTWAIAYDGLGGLHLGLDENLIVTSNHAGVATTATDRIRIGTSSSNTHATGTNEVYFDKIKLTRNVVPQWTAYYPHISGVSVPPEADATSVPVVVNVGGASQDWFTDPDVELEARLYDGSNLVATSASHNLDAPTVSLEITGGDAGPHRLVVDLLNDGTLVDRSATDLDLLSSVQLVEPTASLTSSPGAGAVFTKVEEMQNGAGQPAGSAGWARADFTYRGLDATDQGNILSMIETTDSAEPLTLPVDLDGWFAVYVGYLDGTEQFEASVGSTSRTVKLHEAATGDLFSEQNLREKFVMAADFDGTELTISPSPTHGARIAYVKLRGMTSGDVAAYTTPNEGSNGKRVIYNNDGYTHFTSLKYNNVAALQERAVELYENQDVGAMDWSLGTTMQLNYDSAYAGAPFASINEDDPTVRELDLYGKAMMYNIHDEGGNWPPAVLAQAAQAAGVNFNISLRMNAFYSEGFPALNGAVYYDTYTVPGNDTRQEDANGNRTFRLSLHYASFRDYIKDVLSEAAAIPNVDGVNLDFGRYPYVFGYELTDPGSRKAVITGLLSDIRTALPGKTISVRIPHRNYEDYGLDPEAWVDQGLVDVLIPSNIRFEDFFDVSPWVSMVDGTSVELYAGVVADLSGGDRTKEEEAILRNGGSIDREKSRLSQVQYQKRAHEVYEAGADGVYIFNDWWNHTGALGLLGDKVKVQKWYRFGYHSDLIESPVFVMAP